MKQFLTKLIEIARRIFGLMLELTRRVIALLQSVEIDQPRGVILCVVLQLVVLLSLILAFRPPAANRVEHVSGMQPGTTAPLTSDPITEPEPTGPTEPPNVPQ